eukprot:Lankesteria_metandrocarpae@DN5492_c0_g1_i12.p1
MLKTTTFIRQRTNTATSPDVCFIRNSGPPLLASAEVTNNPVEKEHRAVIIDIPHTLKIGGDQHFAACRPPVVDSSHCKQCLLARQGRKYNARLCPRCHAIRNASQMSVSNGKDLGRLGWLAARSPEKSSYVALTRRELVELAERWEAVEASATIRVGCDLQITIEEVD